MHRTAAAPSFTLLAMALMAAVLFLPWGNPGLAATTAKCCRHGAAPGPGISSGSCCTPGAPGHCGAACGAGMLGCRCPAGSPVFVSLPSVLTPTWQVSAYFPTGVSFSSPLLPSSFFHPPEFTSLAATV